MTDTIKGKVYEFTNISKQARAEMAKTLRHAANELDKEYVKVISGGMLIMPPDKDGYIMIKSDITLKVTH